MSKFKKTFKTIFFLMLVLIYIFITSEIEFQNDTLFDIKLGEKYVNDGINIQDDFSIHENLKYVSHHFIPSIITYIIYNIFGFSGLHILQIILTIILAALFYASNRLFLKSKKLSYMFIFIELVLMNDFISIRAQMYSYIILLLAIIFLELFLRYGKKRYIVFLTILPFILVNFHAGIIAFYFIIIFTYFSNFFKFKILKLKNEEKYVSKLKYLLIPIVIGALTTFINPFGLDGVVYGFKTVGNSFITNYILEFQPFSLNSTSSINIYIFLSIMLAVYINTSKKIKIHHILLFVGTTFMTFIAIRNFSLLVITSVVSLTYVEDIINKLNDILNIGVVKKEKALIKNIEIAIFATITLIFAMNTFVNKQKEYLPKTLYPLEAVKFLKENGLENKRIFNDYSYGSLLMLNDIKVFIDSRCDLYTSEYNKGTNVAFDYINASMCLQDYNKILLKYNIEYLLINKETSLAKNIEDNDNFSLIYQDNIVYIFKVNKKMLKIV